jgi:hypothetical protein
VVESGKKFEHALIQGQERKLREISQIYWIHIIFQQRVTKVQKVPLSHKKTNGVEDNHVPLVCGILSRSKYPRNHSDDSFWLHQRLRSIYNRFSIICPVESCWLPSGGSGMNNDVRWTNNLLALMKSHAQGPDLLIVLQYSFCEDWLA